MQPASKCSKWSLWRRALLTNHITGYPCTRQPPRQVSFAIVRDTIDLLNKQVTWEVTARPTCLETASWLPIIVPIILLDCSFENTKIEPLQSVVLPGWYRCRGFSWRAARTRAFSRPDSPLAFPCPERQACSTERIAARRSNRCVNGFFFFFFSKRPVYCAGVCIIFALIMQVGTSGRKYWPLIGCCHLNQMFGGSFSPGRSHTKDYANAGLRASAIFDSQGEHESTAWVLYRMRAV